MSLDDFYVLPCVLQADVLNVPEYALVAELARRTHQGKLPLHLSRAEREYLWAVIVCRSELSSPTPPRDDPSRTEDSDRPSNSLRASTPPGRSDTATDE